MAFRTTDAGETIWLDKNARRLEAVVLAVAEADGFTYTGGDIVGYARVNPRAAKYVRTAEAVIKAYKDAR